MTVEANGELHAAVHTPSVDPTAYRVSIVTEFDDYATALAGEGVTLTISDVGQPTIERTYKPGVCADEGMDWEYELLSGYVDGDRVPLPRPPTGVTGDGAKSPTHAVSGVRRHPDVPAACRTFLITGAKDSA